MMMKVHGDYISQVPPKYSAIRIQGKHAYELARDGKSVEMAAKIVSVYAMRLDRPWEETRPQFELTVNCGSGTYVR